MNFFFGGGEGEGGACLMVYISVDCTSGNSALFLTERDWVGGGGEKENVCACVCVCVRDCARACVCV